MTKNKTILLYNEISILRLVADQKKRDNERLIKENAELKSLLNKLLKRKNENDNQKHNRSKIESLQDFREKRSFSNLY